uniref:Uncharacterized protein n=1 Tax=Arundo donax TaxID=35708 RepID=A0A0A8YR37_ARUDO
MIFLTSQVLSYNTYFVLICHCITVI